MRRALPALTVVTVLLGGCHDTSGPADQYALLVQNVALWEQRGLASYQFTVQRICECLPEQAGPVVVEVRNGVVNDRRYTTGTTVSPQYDDLFRPVSGLFDLIREAINFPAAALGVRYDGYYGFPESIQIDWVAGDVDDEVSYLITDFEPLPPG